MTNATLAPAPPAALLQGATRLADWGVISASGDDAATFLHGQLTQAMLGLSADEARFAGYCSPKGRLLASFVVWQRAPGQLLLACSADLLAPTLKRLSMFVLRAKCRLADTSADVPLFGLAGAAAVEALGVAAPLRVWGRSSVDGEPGADVVRLPDAAGTPRFLWAGAAPPALSPLAHDAWRWLEVQSGVVRIVAATSELFVPQMVNFELVGGVDFQKGCYPGQEIVARSQYRGTVKRRTFLFDCDGAASVGQEAFAGADALQPAATIAAAAPVPGGDGACSVLAEARLATLVDSLHLGSLDGPLLAPRPLPYALPLDVDTAAA